MQYYSKRRSTTRREKNVRDRCPIVNLNIYNIAILKETPSRRKPNFYDYIN